MRKKTQINDWQRNISKETGLLPLVISGGQVARYRESIYEFEIIDLYDQYDPDEALKVCVEKIHKASLPIDTFLHLTETVMAFKKIGRFTYYYKTGHDYTD